jgi:hypothetical protein
MKVFYCEILTEIMFYHFSDNILNGQWFINDRHCYFILLGLHLFSEHDHNDLTYFYLLVLLFLLTLMPKQISNMSITS